MQEDPEATWSSYEKLCACGGSLSYPEILAQADMKPAYTEGRVREVVLFVRKYLNLKE